MLVITGLLTAAGLTACLNVTQDIPDVTAQLSRPGGRDIKVIVDDDGYIELRLWTGPGTTPSEITTTVTRAITVLTAPMAARPTESRVAVSRTRMADAVSIPVIAASLGLSPGVSQDRLYK